MKLNRIGKGIPYSISMIGMLYALISTEVYAGTMGPVNLGTGRIYAGVFGGAGTSNKVDISQFGTAYYLEAAGGPLAVNSFGKTDRRTVGFVGGQVGYQWSEILLNSFNSAWTVAPAAELEGYYLGRSKFRGHDINNDTVRLPEHDFKVTYPMSTGVFLTNAVLNLNLANYARFHPYVGAGIGGAAIDITDAKSRQVAPPELGVNHYNSKTSDTESTFAAQAKAGLNVELTANTSVFVEYRWLYLASTSYTFGSTVYPAHVATSSWLVKINSQYYNMGAVGLRYSV